MKWIETIDMMGNKFRFDIDSAQFSINLAFNIAPFSSSSRIKTVHYSIYATVDTSQSTMKMLIAKKEYQRLFDIFMKDSQNLIINGEDYETKDNVS